MSQLIGNAQPQFRLQEDEKVLHANEWQRDGIQEHHGDSATYASGFWPRRGGFVGDLGLDLSMMESVYYEPEITRGTNSRFGYQGTTRDVNNSPIGACTVKLFLTADDSKVATDITSEAYGTFVISTPFYAPHYLVTRKSGSPEVAGVTVSTNLPNA